MHERGMAFQPHRLDHAERGQRIDETGSALRGARARRQNENVGRLEAAVLRIHGAADRRDRLAHERARRGRGTRLHDDAGALVADGHRLVEARRHRPQPGVGHTRRDDRVGAAGRAHRGQIGRTGQQAEIGRIDRCRLDAHHDLVLGRLRRRNLDQRQFEFAALADQRTQLQSARGVIRHRHSSRPASVRPALARIVSCMAPM